MAAPKPVVGVRALKARLSAYLRDVARGSVVTIGDRRRRPIARLVPVEQSADRDVLDRLAERGVIQRGIGKPGQAPRVRARPGSRPVAELVIEDRA